MYFIPDAVTTFVSAALGLCSLCLAVSYTYHLITKGAVETTGRDIAYIAAYLIAAAAFLSFVVVCMRMPAPPTF
jgi:hypothetical protein